ncbi:MAG: MoaD/ThiS family protein [Kineosporiaceae bacterium]
MPVSSGGGTTTPPAGVPAPSHEPVAAPSHTPAAALSVDVRYFAGAAAAAGRDAERVELAAGARLADLVTSLHRSHAGRLDRVLSASSFLLDGVHAGPEVRLHDGAEVDVLPPFAGG